MKCYVCAREGRDTDAVAACIACGMGVCMTHVRREEVELVEGGYPFPARRLKKALPRMLCPECFEAYRSG
ncbi:MAG TPA: DUF2180 family protein [Methanoregulaceae archaeon]|nr:DUF2180 family protein [Methanoregulaceae archaeon]HOV66828.1 DUF2180 family protein [Methanoregulaceae archaeon]HQJ87400.1 DUF2180 family protein [Methanoregulaceae archaeon]